MNINSAPLRITLTGQFAAALRLAAEADKRTMTAFLEVNLPLLAPYAQALGVVEKASRPVPAPVVAVPIAPLPPQGPDEPWIPVYKRQEMAAAAAALASGKT